VSDSDVCHVDSTVFCKMRIGYGLDEGGIRVPFRLLSGDKATGVKLCLHLPLLLGSRACGALSPLRHTSSQRIISVQSNCIGLY
jgi:hypothetical protein